MSGKKKIEIDGGESLAQNPFARLDAAGLPGRSTPERPPESRSDRRKAASPGMRLDVRREKAGRGGKTVTVIDGLAPLDARLRRDLVARLKRSLGVGGALKGASIELQGDHCETLMTLLAAEGFRPVRTGG